MAQVLDYLQKLAQNEKLLSTLQLLGALLLVLFAARLILRRSNLSPDQKVRVRQVVWTLGVVLVGVSILGIWAELVMEMLVAMTAVALAAVVACKELILCLLGWLYKIFSGTHHLGDRVQIGEVRGDVVQVRILSSSLLEINPESGQNTGRILTLPHSMLLLQPIVNETKGGGFKWHEITVEVPDPKRIFEAKRILEGCVKPVQEDVRKTMLKRLREMQEEYAVRMEILDPKVYVSVREGKPLLNLRLAVPPRKARDIEHQILIEFFGAYLGEEQNPSLEDTRACSHPSS